MLSSSSSSLAAVVLRCRTSLLARVKPELVSMPFRQRDSMRVFTIRSADSLDRSLEVSKMSSSIQSRKDDIEAKKAKLAELKRQRELRSKDVSSRKSLGPAATPAVKSTSVCVYSEIDWLTDSPASPVVSLEEECDADQRGS